MATKLVELQHIGEPSQEWEAIERAIVDFFKKEIYLPLLAELGAPKKTLQNSTEDVIQALLSGRITFYRGHFSGRFDAAISRELKRLGAEWDRRTGSFKIPFSKLSLDIKNAIRGGEARYLEKMRKVDQRLEKILPEEITSRLKLEKFFDSALWKFDKRFKHNVSKITIAPELTKGERDAISKDWANNLKLYVKDFTETEVKSLRKQMQASVFTGNRYEDAAKKIQKSFNVSQNKAKFLARQETNLLLSKYQSTRYQEAGVTEYKWMNVAGSPNHPVRPMHKALGERSKRGETFRWDKPPVVNDKGEHKNPGEDYNCRCYPIPVVRFK